MASQQRVVSGYSDGLVSAYSSGLASARLFYRVVAAAAELCEATQLCVFILGTRYLCLGVLRRVFGVRHAVSVLVSRLRCFWFLGFFSMWAK